MSTDSPPDNLNIDSQQLLDRLARIEATLALLVDQKLVKDWYTPAEVGEIVGRAEWTVREWCRLNRVHAEKRPCGRGSSLEWIIAHAELERIRNEGLLPDPRVIRRR
jgi:hypothetical protein